MRARCGPPAVVHIADVPAPEVGPGDLRVTVQGVLVSGAAGAIGSAAVQLLADLGARATAVCGAAHAGLVRGLGADRVIDRDAVDFTKDGHRYVTDRRYPLGQVVEAYRYVETGQKVGNVVITVVPPG